MPKCSKTRMPRKPKKLMKWLCILLYSGKYKDSGLVWEDEYEGKLWLPWPRQKDKNWTAEKSAIILDYIQMQGGYKKGDKLEYVTWKARFRTALNKEKCLDYCNKLEKKDGLVRKLYQIVDFDFQAFRHYQHGNNNEMESSYDCAATKFCASPSGGSDSGVGSFTEGLSPQNPEGYQAEVLVMDIDEMPEDLHHELDGQGIVLANTSEDQSDWSFLLDRSNDRILDGLM